MRADPIKVLAVSNDNHPGANSANNGRGKGRVEEGIRGVPGILFFFLSPKILNRLLKPFQLRFGTQYGSRNEEPAKTNGGHLQAVSPGKVAGPADRSH
jgi:hypothetical protein